jgi:hypothetical protein
MATSKNTSQPLLDRKALGWAARRDAGTRAAGMVAHLDGRHGNEPTYWAGLCVRCAEEARRSSDRKAR